MFTVRELKKFGAGMTLDQLHQLLGPFVLIRRPPEPLMQKRQTELLSRTIPARRGVDDSAAVILEFMLDFDELLVLPAHSSADEWTVGRALENQFRVDDASVSKRHAKLSYEAPHYFIEDLRSMNGTFRNEAEVKGKAPLADGTVLTFGDMDYWFLTIRTLYERLSPDA